MTALAEALFWACAALLVYAHVGYPAVAWAWSRLRPRPPRLTGPAALPRVTVLVVAHDEAERIEGRIANLLALDYPRDRLTIAVASDGSTDGTAARARRLPGVEVYDFPSRRGKPAALNALVPRARGEVVVLADARQRFEPGALRALVAPFGDPEVGAVSGELVLDAEPAGAPRGAGAYWTYEKFLRRCEGLVDSTVGATGAIYAIRRSLFEPLPEDTVLDDMRVACRVVRRGYRVLFEPRARAHDRAFGLAAELERKARTLAGNFQLFSRERWLLSPRRNRLWFQTVSHKALRLVCPLLLAGALVSSAALAREPLYAAALLLQLCLYGAALAGALLDRRGAHVRALLVPRLFCLLHYATLVGFVRFLRGRASPTWTRVPPPPAAGAASAALDGPRPDAGVPEPRREVLLP
jgi:cellulose synthase/poly-beta-1,6-N-acetylglucosamine synthase-like glycosyltransferase